MTRAEQYEDLVVASSANGQPVRLKGICVHEDHIARGRSLTDADRRDIVREYGLPRAKVAVVPPAPMLPEYGVADDGTIEATRRKHALPPRFAWRYRSCAAAG